MAFTESSQMIHDIPTWIECAIYRSDRTMPMVVREYFVEVKNETPIWQKMPRRMLRHRALQQCARLSFGIALPDPSFSQHIPKPANPITHLKDTQMTPPISTSHEHNGISAAPTLQEGNRFLSRKNQLKEHLQHLATL
jgi:hypothetical protein